MVQTKIAHQLKPQWLSLFVILISSSSSLLLFSCPLPPILIAVNAESIRGISRHNENDFFGRHSHTRSHMNENTRTNNKDKDKQKQQKLNKNFTGAKAELVKTSRKSSSLQPQHHHQLLRQEYHQYEYRSRQRQLRLAMFVGTTNPTTSNSSPPSSLMTPVPSALPTSMPIAMPTASQLPPTVSPVAIPPRATNSPTKTPPTATNSPTTRSPDHHDDKDGSPDTSMLFMERNIPGDDGFLLICNHSLHDDFELEQDYIPEILNSLPYTYQFALQSPHINDSSSGRLKIDDSMIRQVVLEGERQIGRHMAELMCQPRSWEDGPTSTLKHDDGNDDGGRALSSKTGMPFFVVQYLNTLLRDRYTAPSAAQRASNATEQTLETMTVTVTGQFVARVHVNRATLTAMQVSDVTLLEIQDILNEVLIQNSILEQVSDYLTQNQESILSNGQPANETNNTVDEENDNKSNDNGNVTRPYPPITTSSIRGEDKERSSKLLSSLTISLMLGGMALLAFGVGTIVIVKTVRRRHLYGIENYHQNEKITTADKTEIITQKPHQQPLSKPVILVPNAADNFANNTINDKMNGFPSSGLPPHVEFMRNRSSNDSSLELVLNEDQELSTNLGHDHPFDHMVYHGYFNESSFGGVSEEHNYNTSTATGYTTYKEDHSNNHSPSEMIQDHVLGKINVSSTSRKSITKNNQRSNTGSSSDLEGEKQDNFHDESLEHGDDDEESNRNSNFLRHYNNYLRAATAPAAVPAAETTTNQKGMPISLSQYFGKQVNNNMLSSSAPNNKAGLVVPEFDQFSEQSGETLAWVGTHVLPTLQSSIMPKENEEDDDSDEISTAKHGNDEQEKIAKISNTENAEPARLKPYNTSAPLSLGNGNVKRIE